jgi:hypothetical protein
MKMYKLEWSSEGYHRRVMTCVAINIEEAVIKFKEKWNNVYKNKREKFIDEIKMDDHETIETFIEEHDIGDVVESSWEE